jgi:hypothetical protein
MKKIIICVILLLASVICAFGQISKSNPLGGEIKEIYETEDNTPRVKIAVQLLAEPDATKQAPICNGVDIGMNVLTVTQRDAARAQQQVNKPVTLLPPLPADINSLSKVFQLEISTSQTLNLGSNPFRLPANWESFTYNLRCKVDGTDQVSGILHMQKPAAATIQNFNIAIGSLTWSQDVRGQLSNEMLLPVTSISTSLVAEIELKQGAAQVKTVKPILLLKGEVTPVRFNASGFGEVNPIEIRVKPTELTALELTLKGETCTNDPTGSVCLRTPKIVQAFQIDQSNSELKNLKITSLAGSKTIIVRTTANAKPGSMSAKLNGGAINLTGAGTNFQVTLDAATLQRLNEGAENTLEFEGESIEGIKLSEKPFKFEKNTKPSLIGFPTFALDGGSLKLVYKLSGDIEESQPTLKYRTTGGTAATFENPNCRLVDGNRECSPVLRVSFETLDSTLKKQPQIPVILEIHAKERGKPGLEPIGIGFGFDLMNQAAIKPLLDDISVQWKANRNDSIAKQKIATEVLKVDVANEQVEETFNKYIKENVGSAKRQRYLQFLVGVGNFALKGFGIPIQIPTSLAN